MPPLPVITPKLPGIANVPHAIPYQGSKRALAPAIVLLLPRDTEVLYEPFAGSAAVTIAARHTRRVRAAEIGDANGPLIALWTQLIASPVELADAYESLWHEQLADPRNFYLEVRTRFNASQEPHLLLYLLARCVNAAVRYNTRGEFNQGADQRRLGAKPLAMRHRIMRTAAVLAGTQTRTGDYSPSLLGATPKDLVYLDPPYEGVSGTRDNRYMQGLEKASFERVLSDAIERNVSFILSYDGATGDKRYGERLRPELGMLHMQLFAGRSSQATLNGSAHDTVESLYLSPALVERLGGETSVATRLRHPSTSVESPRF